MAVVTVIVMYMAVTSTATTYAKERFDRDTESECHFNRGCLRDLHRRQACNRKEGTPGRECYIRYAARYYSQPVGYALSVAKCESYPWLNHLLTAPQQGMWQFNIGTWRNGVPKMFHKGAGVYSPKYSSLAAMYYWKTGHIREWVCA